MYKGGNYRCYVQKKQIEHVKMDMHQTNKGTSKRNKQTFHNQEVVK
ncbi:hypothetical protein bmyco0002_15720 [Bacillus pseudomycoides]|nr:hypothetical protein bmyco0002_15720 [Bacillus pseudomycoides]